LNDYFCANVILYALFNESRSQFVSLLVSKLLSRGAKITNMLSCSVNYIILKWLVSL